jgi:hypothetical protein
MKVNEIDWSLSEMHIAEEAYKKAYERETAALIEVVCQRATAIAKLEDMWLLNDLLSAKRHEIDGKYDFKYSILVFVFADLVKQGWLNIIELDGLSPDKLAKISALTRM